MTRSLKQWAKRHWPRLRLRTILFATLFLVAALPGVGAVALRVYENTLVRQTEAELVAQGAALAAAAGAVWPGAAPSPPPSTKFRPEPPRIDLSASPILSERPKPKAAAAPARDAVEGGIRLAPVFAATRRTTLASIILLDRSGTTVAGTGERGSYAGLPEVRAALVGRPATVIRRNGDYRAVYRFEWLSRAAAIRVHHARPIIVNGQVVGVLLLSRSARALFRGLYEDRGKIALGVLVILGLLTMLTGVLSRGIARPIEALGSATKAVAAGRGTVPEPPPTAAVEIQALFCDFASMADAIDRRSRYLRDFAHAVSHEFKTPLAGIRGAIELMQDHDAVMSAAERQRFLANANADAKRLSLLVTRLLDLARADMGSVEAGAATDLAPVLAATADALRRPDFAVEIAAGSPPPVAIPARTLESVLAGLGENSQQAGASALRLSTTIEGGAVVLRVTDNGPGVPPGDSARVFEPFFTTRRVEGGSGLGLPIIRSLLGAAGAEIELDATTAGAAFRIRLPIAG